MFGSYFLRCEFLIGYLAIFQITILRSFHSISYLRNVKKYYYTPFHKFARHVCLFENDRDVDIYDLDASSSNLKASFSEMIDGIELEELGIILMVSYVLYSSH